MVKCAKCNKTIGFRNLFNSIIIDDKEYCGKCAKEVKKKLEIEKLKEEKKKKICASCHKQISFEEKKHVYTKKGKDVNLCENCHLKQIEKKEKIEFKRKCKACNKV